MIGLFRQTLAAGGILALAWWISGAAPSNVTAAPGLANDPAQFSVNRAAKGDRLPVTRAPALRLPQSNGQVPFGCERAFSPAAAPQAQAIYGRCLA